MGSTVLGALVGAAFQFILEVPGCAGAVWGSSEIFGLRTADNRKFWVLFCKGVFVAAMIRFCFRYSIKFGQPGVVTAFVRAILAPEDSLMEALSTRRDPKRT